MAEIDEPEIQMPQTQMSRRDFQQTNLKIQKSCIGELQIRLGRVRFTAAHPAVLESQIADMSLQKIREASDKYD